MTTVGHVFEAADVAADLGGSPQSGSENPGARVHERAREYRSLPVVGKIRAAGVDLAADLRSAWWAPSSLPTLRRAWAERMPDRSTVPGENAVLYGGWVAYNHSLGLAIPAVGVAVVAVVAFAVWAARHPARLILTTVIAVAVSALVFG